MKLFKFSVFLFAFPVWCIAQTNEIENLQKFVAATIQMPFKAKAANVQGTVNVKVIFADTSENFTTEIVQSLREDCDAEALRVVRLINAQNLLTVLGGRRTGVIEVPFYNHEIFSYNNGIVTEYFDKDKRVISDTAKARFVKRYQVDTLNGFINSDVEYIEIKKGRFETIRVDSIIIDSLRRYIPSFLESSADTLRLFKTIIVGNENQPPIATFFENGNLWQKFVNNVIYMYYPNGRISHVYQPSRDGSPESIDTHWFYNGQIAFVRRRRLGSPELYMAVWDTTGKQLIIDGNGLDKYYEGNGNNIIKISGVLKDGYHEGVFTGVNIEGEKVFEKIYQKGVLVKEVYYAK